ncbi:MAG: hypothetical protein U9Q07_03875 [Planctomycetota bacterium]|nr:hypothetical protein [Planctomycetota bacterium]
MSKTIVYGVAAGEYSGYWILAIFDTREKAEAYYNAYTVKCWECQKYSRITPDGADECKCPKCGKGNLLRGVLDIEEFTMNPEPEANDG